MMNNISIGDTFHTWKVIKKDDKEKYCYNYICQCIGCGDKKIISKYKLLNNSYAICKKCGVKNVLEKNWDLIKKYWNSDLNPIVDIDEILKNPTNLYWFTCPNGHNFKKTIRDFSISKCPSCRKSQERLKQDNALLTLYNNERIALSILNEIYSSMFNEVIKLSNTDLLIKDINLIVSVQGLNHMQYNKLYHNNESEFLSIVESDRAKAAKYKDEGFKYKIFTITKNFAEDIDKIKKFVLEFSQEIKY